MPPWVLASASGGNKMYCLRFHCNLGVEAGTTCPAPVQSLLSAQIAYWDGIRVHPIISLYSLPLGHFFLFSEQIIATGYESDPVVHILGGCLREVQLTRVLHMFRLSDTLSNSYPTELTPPPSWV